MVGLIGLYDSKNLIPEQELAGYVLVPATTNRCLLENPINQAAFL
jgi:hypothetical protein